MSASSVSTRMPEKPFASTFARNAIDARTSRTGNGAVDAGGVAAQQIDLQLRQIVAIDPRFGERAEAGVDAVDGRIAVGAADRRLARDAFTRARGAGARPTAASSSAIATSASSVRRSPSSRIM